MLMAASKETCVEPQKNHVMTTARNAKDLTAEWHVRNINPLPVTSLQNRRMFATHAMTGGIASFAINKGAGWLFDYSEAKGAAFQFLGFEGKEAGYMIIFCYCAVAYLIAWTCMKTLVPRYKKVVL